MKHKVALVNSTTDTLKRTYVKRQEPGLVSFYVIRSENGAGLLLQLRSPHGCA